VACSGIFKPYQSNTAEEINVEGLFPLVDVGILETRQGRQGAMVDNQAIDPTESLDGELGELGRGRA